MERLAASLSARLRFWLCAAVLSIAAVAATYLLQIDFDANRGLPTLVPAPSAAVQQKLLAEFQAYPPVPLTFASAIPRGTDAKGLQPLLSQMQLTSGSRVPRIYKLVVGAAPTPEMGEGSFLREELVVRIDGDPARVAAIGVNRTYVSGNGDN